VPTARSKLVFSGRAVGVGRSRAVVRHSLTRHRGSVPRSSGRPSPGRLLIGQPRGASTAAGRGPRSLALSRRANERPARPDGGEVPRAATGRSPNLSEGLVYQHPQRYLLVGARSSVSTNRRSRRYG
jgi:hypothetical protein